MIDIDPQLQSSYAACRRMHRRFDPTYYWATRRLPREIRPAVHALYGFVRGADELVDGPRRPPQIEPRLAIDIGHGRARSLRDEPRRGDIPVRHPALLDERVEPAVGNIGERQRR